MIPGSAPPTPASQDPSLVFTLPFSYSAVFSPRYQRLPLESCAYQSKVSSFSCPPSLTVSCTTTASISMIVFVSFVTTTSFRSTSPSRFRSR